MNRKTVILASTSRYRRALLTRVLEDFEAVAPGVDESGLDLPPREVAATLSRAKAQAVATQHPETVVIGSDQVATIDGEVLGKPGSVEAACAQLRKLSGRTHELITGLCVIADGECHEHLDVHRLTLRQLSDAEIADYVRRDDPTDCAGAYKIEGLGIALMESIEGRDFTAITGLPLIATRSLLGRAGVPLLG